MKISDLDPSRVPTHIAAVMDGNGRWAEKRKLPRTEGHTAGEQSLMDVLEGADDLGVKWFTVFAFSTENWSRPPEEVEFLLNFNEKILLERQDELHERNVRIRFIGRRNRQVPKRLIRRMEEAENLTKKNTGLTFTLSLIHI